MIHISILLLLILSNVAAFGTSTFVHRHKTVQTTSNSLRLQYDSETIALSTTEDVDSINGYSVTSGTGLHTNPLIATTLQRPAKANKIFDANFQTWKRRLDTKEDPLNIHKWAGTGWSLSSAAILGCGAFSGFTEVPTILEPIAYIFLVSTLTQSLSSVPMAIQYRSNEPSVRRGFISSAITSISLAFTGFWLGPFGDHVSFGSAHMPILPDFSTAVMAITLCDTARQILAFGHSKEIFAKITEKIRINDSKGLPEQVAELLVTFPTFLPLNMALLHLLWVHGSDARTEILNGLVSQGSSSDLFFYATMITSIAICVGNLTATLRHRQLISSDVNNVAVITSLVAAVAFNLRAAGVDMLFNA